MHPGRRCSYGTIGMLAYVLTALVNADEPATEEVMVEGLIANAGFTNNYLWRGVSQSDDRAAVSGGLDYAYSFMQPLGIYTGLWLSNVDFGDPDDGDPQYELDLYAGLSGSFGRSGHFGYDVGYIYYAYPDATSDFDFGEVYLGGSWRWLSAMIYKTVNYEDDAAGANAWYYIVDGTVPFKNNVELTIEVGRYAGGDVPAPDDYWHYGVYVSQGEFSLGLIDTDLDEDIDGSGHDPVFQISWVKEFDL